MGCAQKDQKPRRTKPSLPQGEIEENASRDGKKSSGDVGRSLSKKVCQSLQGERIFSIQEAEISWQAIKLEDKLVIGSILASGWLKLWPEAKSLTAKGTAARIEFDPKSLDSYNSLRDTRIQSLILGDETGVLTLEALELEAKESKLAELGATQKATLQGLLLLSQLEFEVSIPVLITRTEAGFRVENTNEPYQLDLRSHPDMADRITELLTVAAVASMEDTVSLGFKVDFNEACLEDE